MKKDQRVVLITGSGQGLGKELAIKFDKKNWHTILHYRNTEPPISKSDRCFWLKGDMKHTSTCDQLVATAIYKGKIDVLINNCGIYYQRLFKKCFSRDILEDIMRINFLAPITLTEMLKRKVFDRQSNPCIVVNVNSMAGIDGQLYEPEYSASKHALRGYFSSLRKDHNIKSMKLVDIFLGAMKTDMTKDRVDWDLLIDPKEVANAIYNACNQGVTSEVTEFHIKRSIYDAVPMR